MELSLFDAASKWDTLEDSARQALKKVITDLVGYPCKLACRPNDGVVDIYVFSMKANKVVDWIEIQPSGAVGVIFDLYGDYHTKAVDRIDDACEAYNEKNGFIYYEGDDGGGDNDDVSSLSSSDSKTDNSDD
jgi:hypothetical protein